MSEIGLIVSNCTKVVLLLVMQVHPVHSFLIFSYMDGAKLLRDHHETIGRKTWTGFLFHSLTHTGTATRRSVWTCATTTSIQR